MHSPTRGVVTAGGDGVPAGVEPDAVDVGGVALPMDRVRSGDSKRVRTHKPRNIARSRQSACPTSKQHYHKPEKGVSS